MCCNFSVQARTFIGVYVSVNLKDRACVCVSVFQRLWNAAGRDSAV